jgi:hypothetical protein
MTWRILPSSEFHKASWSVGGKFEYSLNLCLLDGIMECLVVCTSMYCWYDCLLNCNLGCNWHKDKMAKLQIFRKTNWRWMGGYDIPCVVNFDTIWNWMTTRLLHCTAHHGKVQYTGWFKKMDSISYVYISRTIHGMWMICITFERGGPKFSNTTARALA